MDHDVVVRQQMTERYLLNELDPNARDEFEEHFFECPDCALDVRAGTLFVEQSKAVLGAEESIRPPVLVPETVTPPASGGWFAWLRPAFAVPVMALLLIVVGYQNLVTYPRLQQAENRPELLPWASVNVGSWGSKGTVITARPGEGFLLLVRSLRDGGYSSYNAELYNPAGKQEWSLAIPASPAEDWWPVRVPGAKRDAGSYILKVYGVTTAGEKKEVGREAFDLQIQK